MTKLWLVLIALSFTSTAEAQRWIVKNPQSSTKAFQVQQTLDFDGDKYVIIQAEATASSIQTALRAEAVTPDLLIERIEAPSREISVKGNWYVRALDYAGAESLPNGQGITVAVLDTGIDDRHEHLAGRVWINKNEIAGNGLDDDQNGYVDDIHGWNFAENNRDSSDFHGHGTHCAGLIAAKPERYARTQGVAQGAQVMSLRVFGYDNGPVFMSQAATAMKYAVDHGARVISNSWRVYRGDKAFEVDEKKVALLRSAIEYAGRRDVVIVVASGNESQNIDSIADTIYPAGFTGLKNLLVVAASDATNGRAWGSNYGQIVHVAAPGEDITSTLPGNQWGSKSGTSMATPIVAGAVARGLSAGLSSEQAVTQIIETANRGRWTGVIQGGVIHLQRYLSAAKSVMSSAPPAAPTEAGHPGSLVYPYSMTYQNFKVNGRNVDVFLPTGANVPAEVPVVIYGHGQAIGLDSYRLTFEHLAKKGIAVVYPQFDTGFFDQDWRRMADDFNRLTKAAIDRNPSLNGPLIYSGHSKGAYVSLMAAGAPNNPLRPSALVLFAPAGYDSQYLQKMDPALPLTLVWGEDDTIIKKDAVVEIYQRSPAKHKQFIKVTNYADTQPRLSADHFFPLTKASTFGGKNGISPHQYFGAWAWMIGAVRDAEAKNPITNEFIYGIRASDTGLDGLTHQIQRSW